MLYIVIIAAIGTLAFPINIAYQEWRTGAEFAFVCLAIVTLGFFFLVFMEETCDKFERKVISTSTKETKKLIYPLDMSTRKPDKYFIIPRKDDAYHLYVKTKTGFEKTEIPIEETKLKQCNKEFPNPCVVKTVTIETHQPICKYNKLLYNGVLFLHRSKQPKEKITIVSYTLYVPENTIIQ